MSRFLHFVLLSIFLTGNAFGNQDRLALVIGNSAYSNASLSNPVNDAVDVASELRRHNFKVTLLTDADQKTMEDAIRQFGRKLNQGSTGLFYFAGHGVQSDGQNYLIPLAADVSTETDLRYKAVNLSMILDQMKVAANPINMVVLDACRNNPLQRKFRSNSRGLARVSKTPNGFLLAYATAPGELALDGEGRNGIYTKHFLDSLKYNSHLPVELLFKEVLKGVKNETRGVQIPWVTASLERDFYFNTSNTSTQRVKEKYMPMSSDESFVSIIDLSKDKKVAHKIGTGFFISSTSVVATSWENVRRGNQLYAYDPKTKEFSPAVVIKNDPKYDIAILGTSLPAKLSRKVEFIPSIGSGLKVLHTENGETIEISDSHVIDEQKSDIGTILRVSSINNNIQTGGLVKDSENKIAGLYSFPIEKDNEGGAYLIPIDTLIKMIPRYVTNEKEAASFDRNIFGRIINTPITRDASEEAEDWLDKSNDAFEDGNWFEVIRTADVALRNNPAYLEAYLNRSGAYINLGLIAKAKEDLEKSIIINPNSPPVLFNWSIIYEKEGKLRTALEYLTRSCVDNFKLSCSRIEAITGYHPTNESDWFLDRANEFFDNQNYFLTASLASRALTSNPRNSNAYITRSASLTTLEQPLDGLRDADTAINLNPDSAFAYNNKGFALERLGKTVDAYIEYQKGCVIQEKSNPNFIACLNSSRIKPF